MAAQPLYVSANGTGVPDPFGPGFSTDIGFAVNSPWDYVMAQLVGTGALPKIGWQPCGYPAAVTNMGKSVQALRSEVVFQVKRHENDGSCPVGYPLVLGGYSQSAIGMTQVWVKDILPPNGVLHNRLDDVEKRGGLILFGDPTRCPGIANGHLVAGFPMPTEEDGAVTGGIAGPGDLRANETPDCLLSCALDGDLYAACPVGEDPWSHEDKTGKVETRIYDFIMKTGFVSFLSIALALEAPIGMVKAIINGMVFAAAGPAAPHWQYGPFVPAMVGWLLNRIG
jgi:hypothetical protein